MVWFEILPSLVITAAPLLVVAAPALYIGNWYFLNGKVNSTFLGYVLHDEYVLFIYLIRNMDQKI